MISKDMSTIQFLGFLGLVSLVIDLIGFYQTVRKALRLVRSVASQMFSLVSLDVSGLVH